MCDQEQAVNNGFAHDRSGNEISTTQCGNVRVFGPVIWSSGLSDTTGNEIISVYYAHYCYKAYI